MVVCKCRKATKLYCFVHRTPVCLDCICTTEHEHCVVKQYSDWVNDGDYDWPPLCHVCQESLLDADKATLRLGCLHVSHASCLQQHLESFPVHTAPAGYTCPAMGCHTAVWPPKSQKDASSTLYTNLRGLISGTGVSDALLMAPIPSAGLATPPVPSREQSTNDLSAFSSGATSASAGAGQGPGPGQGPQPAPQAEGAAEGAQMANGQGAAALDGLTSPQKLSAAQKSQNLMGARSRGGYGAGAGAVAVDVEEDLSKDSGHGYASDFESGERKYARRGPVHVQFLRALGLGFLSRPGLPVTSSRRERDEQGDEGDGRLARARRTARAGALDPRKLLLALAIVSCMATMLLLFYRLADGPVV